MVYDDRDRLVLTQDGNLRDENYWLFTKYDELNRPVMTGKYFDNEHFGQSDMLTYINEFYAQSDKYLFETIDLQNEIGYSNQSFPDLECESCEVYNITFYDKYDYISQPQFEDYEFSENGIVQAYDTEYTKGKITTTKTSILPTPGLELLFDEEWLITVLYYDEYDRIV